jgi:nucleotide-binding universal stress UspA family protein
MYKKILIPLDGTQLAELVIPYAKDLAGRLDLDMIILHVSTPEERGLTTMHLAYVERIAKKVKGKSIKVQQRTGSKSGDNVIIAKGKLTVGYPADEILRCADENNVDFILMATHGYSGIKRWAIGSVADKVTRASEVPVLLVRVGIMDEISYDKWPQKTLLVPLDGSKLAESVLTHVKALAKQRGTQPVDVVLLRVCDRPLISSQFSKTSISVGREEQVKQTTALFKQESKHYLAGIEKRLRDAGLTAKTRVIVGNPAKEIIKYASKSPFNLIVMATHGRSGLIRWAYGSVADRILWEGSSPIFLVRSHKSNLNQAK